MNRQQAMPYVSFAVNDSGNQSSSNEKFIPKHARLVGWQCGFEPLFVAVYSTVGVRLDDSDAEEIATELLQKRNWFTDNEDPPSADFVI